MLRSLLLAAGVGVTTCVAVVLCGRLAAGLDPDRARLAVAQGIAGAAIPDSDTPEPHGPRGPHPFNECLIYMMAALHSGAPWHDAVSPLAPSEIVASTEAGGFQVCVPLGEWARTGRIGITLAGYGRYVQGHRLLAALALATGEVRAVPVLLSLLCYGVLGAVLAWNAAMLARRRAWDDEPCYRLGLCVVALGFLLCYGLPGFSRLLSHAPADISLFGFLLVASVREFARRPARARVLWLACFGAWAATFEFLSGPLPMLAATLLVVHGLSLGLPGRTVLRRAALGLAAMGTAFVATFAAKQVALLMVDPAGAVHSAGALARWLRGGRTALAPANPSLIEVGNVLRWHTPDLYGGSEVLAYSVLALAGLQCAAGATAFRVLRPRRLVHLSLLLAPLFIVGAWYGALPRHSVLHAGFMVRLLVWPPTIGWLLTILAAETMMLRAARRPNLFPG